jgi:hypothetical protein
MRAWKQHEKDAFSKIATPAVPQIYHNFASRTAPHYILWQGDERS